MVFALQHGPDLLHAKALKELQLMQKEGAKLERCPESLFKAYRRNKPASDANLSQALDNGRIVKDPYVAVAQSFGGSHVPSASVPSVPIKTSNEAHICSGHLLCHISWLYLAGL
jgi:hypothetical protein